MRKGLTGLEITIVRIIRNESASFIAEAHKTKCVKRYLAKGSGIRKELLEKDQIHYMELGTRQTLLNKDIGNKKDLHCPDIRKKMACLFRRCHWR